MTFLIACRDYEKSENFVSVRNAPDRGTRLIIDTALAKGNQDSLLVKSQTHSPNWIEFYDDKDGFCKLRNDSLFICFKKGRLTTQLFNVFITNGSVFATIKVQSCHSNYRCLPTETRLILNKSAYKINDTIIGRIYCKWSSNADKCIILGTFKLRVMDSTYSFDRLAKDNNLNQFMLLANTNPLNVQSVNLTNCGLTKIPKELLLFKHLEELNLDANNLDVHALSKLQALTTLKSVSFQNCYLSEFPNVVLKLEKLEKLNLYNNGIKELPAAMYNLSNLTELQIGGNSLKNVSPDISKLKKLKTFGFDGTEIMVLPKDIVKLKKLRKVYPTDSMIYFPPELAKCLSSRLTYDHIGNYAQFKEKIPTDGD